VANEDEETEEVKVAAAVAEVTRLREELRAAEEHLLVLLGGPVGGGPEQIDANLRLTIDALWRRGLSARAANSFQNYPMHVEYVWQLVTKTEEELLKQKNFGKKSLPNVRRTLAKLGLILGMQLPKDFRP
jgi:DNA-directed RNA polymerase subunit alpha